MRKIFLFLIPLLFFFLLSNAQTNNVEKNAALQIVGVNKAIIGLTDDDLNNLDVSNSYVDKTIGVRYVYLQQTYKSIPVYNQIQVLAFKNNQLMSNAGGRIAEFDKKVNVISGMPSVTASNAVMAALADKKIITAQIASAVSTKDNGRKVEFGKLGVSRENITAQLMWFPDDNGSVRLGWQVYFIPVTTSDYWLSKVDASNGTILGADNLTAYCSWDDPNHQHVFGENHKHTNSGGDNLFDFTKVTKIDTHNKTNSPSLADNASYRVVPYPFEAPTFMPGAFPGTAPGNSTVVNNPWTSVPAAFANATTLKWHSTATTGADFNYTRGNNVWAYQDPSTVTGTGTPNEAASATSTTPLPTLNFAFGNAPDYTLDPQTNNDNQKFNVTNLFYYNNILHDILYTHGFDEAAGNFQQNNLSRNPGGATVNAQNGNDYVFGDAQDGSGSNNANFATPPDGSSGRMQMYLWTTATPRRDGDVDNGIIAHELGHGVSNRLFGGPANASCVQNGEHQGEGISDYIGLMVTQDWSVATVNTGLLGRGIGTFALNQPTTGVGIRSQRYSTDFAINNKKYQAVLPQTGSPHARGEHWCAAAWEATWAIIQQSGTIHPNIYYNGTSTAGNIVAMRIAMQAMKLAPCGSGYIDHRDAWLRADTLLYGGTYSCSIWEAFRKRGMGYFASQGSANSDADQIPDETAFTKVKLTASAATIPAGQNLTYTNAVSTCSRVALVNYLLTDTLPANVVFVSTTNGGIYNAASRVVSWVINQAANSTVNYQFTVTVNGSAFPGNVVIRSNQFNDAVPSLKLFNFSEVNTPVTPILAGCPTVSVPPVNAQVCVNTSASFNVIAVASSAITYLWQVSTDAGVTWTALTNAAPYSGVNTANLTINPSAIGLNNNRYRCFMTTVDCTAGISSNPAVLSVVNGSVGGILTPAAAQICGITNSSKIKLTGNTGIVIRWESSINSGSTWTNIANTTDSLAITNIATTTQYRALVQVTGCSAEYSSVSTITFVASLPLNIVADPGTILCAGDPARLSVNEGGLSSTTAVMNQTLTSAATVITFNFRNNNPFAVTISDISSICNFTGGVANVSAYYKASPINGAPGAISAANGWNQFGSASFPSVGGVLVPFMSGLSLIIPAGATYGIVVSSTNTLGASNIVYSNALSQTIASAGGCDIITGANIGYAGAPPPAAPTFNPRYFIGSLTFSAAGTPVTTGTYLWTPAAGLSSTTSNPVAASPAVTTTYSVTANNGAGCIRNASITLTVNTRPSVTAQPSNITVCSGSTATFTAAGTGTGFTYQWQESTNGGTAYTNITNGGVYSGATTGTLTITGVPATFSNNRYRLSVGGTCPPNANSNGAILTVNALPTVSVTPILSCGGVAGINGTKLKASGANTYTWSPIAGLYTDAAATIAYTGGNADSVYAAPSVFTNYVVKGSNSATGCSSTATAVINYTPNAPIINPAPANMCLGDGVLMLSKAQPKTLSFTTTVNVPIVDNNVAGANKVIDVSGIPAGANITKIAVKMNAVHSWIGDLVVTLKAPNGKILNLDYCISRTNFGTGNLEPGFSNTMISSSGSSSLGSGTQPYTGTFKADASTTADYFGAPTGPTGFAANTGLWSDLYSVANGTWTLAWADVFPGGDVGTFTDWSIDISYQAGLPSTPPVWTPVTYLFTDAGATVPYVAGTPKDTVYVKPPTTPLPGSYTYKVTAQSTPAPGPSNPASVTINDAAPGAPYPSIVNVSQYPATGVSVKRVTLKGISHTFSADADIILQSPTGQNVVLMSDVGGGAALSGVTYTFDDAGAVMGATLNPSGIYQPTNIGATDTWPAPGPGSVTQAAPLLSLFGSTANVNGDWKLFVVDDLGGDFGVIADGWSIDFSYTFPACTSPERTVIVTINDSVKIVTQPVNTGICIDKAGSFSVAATGTGLTYQWQVRPPSGTAFTNVTNGGVYSGATSATLTITAPPLSMNGNDYVCVVSGISPCGGKTTSLSRLTVNLLPTISISAAPYTKLYPGLRTIISSTVTPAAATYTWLKNGVTVPGSAKDLTVDVDGIGNYTLRVTDVNGCTNISNQISITDSLNSKVFVSPNPTSGLFNVRYYSTVNNTGLPRGVNIYDAKGQRIMAKSYSIGTPYAKMEVDLTNHGTGVYTVEVVDVNGNRLAIGRVSVIR
jgi:uncharacterized repeat protein (TIGR01451 family)